jgi:hypothetical protein
MRHLDPKEAAFFLEGEEEVKEMLESMNLSEHLIPKAAGPTVGSLLKERT